MWFAKERYTFVITDENEQKNHAILSQRTDRYLQREESEDMFKAVIMKEQSNLDKKYTVNRRGERVVGSFGERKC